MSRVTEVYVDGRKLEPPPGTAVYPLLVAGELVDRLETGVQLSGCGAKVVFRDQREGFLEIVLTNGELKAHEGRDAGV